MAIAADFILYTESLHAHRRPALSRINQNVACRAPDRQHDTFELGVAGELMREAERMPAERGYRDWCDRSGPTGLTCRTFSSR